MGGNTIDGGKPAPQAVDGGRAAEPSPSPSPSPPNPTAGSTSFTTTPPDGGLKNVTDRQSEPIPRISGEIGTLDDNALGKIKEALSQAGISGPVYFTLLTDHGSIMKYSVEASWFPPSGAARIYVAGPGSSLARASLQAAQALARNDCGQPLTDLRDVATQNLSISTENPNLSAPGLDPVVAEIIFRTLKYYGVLGDVSVTNLGKVNETGWYSVEMKLKSTSGPTVTVVGSDLSPTTAWIKAAEKLGKKVMKEKPQPPPARVDGGTP